MWTFCFNYLTDLEAFRGLHGKPWAVGCHLFG